MTGEARDRVAARLYVGEVEVEFYQTSEKFMATFVERALASRINTKRPSALQPTPQLEAQIDENGESEDLAPGLLVEEREEPSVTDTPEEREEPSVTDTPDGLDDFQPGPNTAAAEENSAVETDETDETNREAVGISQDPKLAALDKEEDRLLKRLEDLRQYQKERAAEEEDGGPKTLIDSSNRVVVSGKEKRKTHKTRRRRAIEAIAGTATTIIVAAPFVAPKPLGEYFNDACSKEVNSLGCIAGQFAPSKAKAAVVATIDKGVELGKGLMDR